LTSDAAIGAVVLEHELARWQGLVARQPQFLRVDDHLLVVPEAQAVEAWHDDIFPVELRGRCFWIRHGRVRRGCDNDRVQLSGIDLLEEFTPE